MKKNLRIAILFTLVTTVMFGLIYPLAVTGSGAAAVSRPGQWQPDPAERPGSRLTTPRPSIFLARLFPFAAVQRRNRIRRIAVRQARNSARRITN